MFLMFNDVHIEFNSICPHIEINSIFPILKYIICIVKFIVFYT